MKKKRGILYVIASPLGNLEDVTLRTLRVLKEEVEVVLAEDTRVTRKFLSHYGISLQLIACNEHKEKQLVTKVIKLLSEGKTLALITDAGTPGISDPGAYIISKIQEAGYPVFPLPGPSAVVTALSASGFFASTFYFCGFPPRKKQQEYWEKIKNLSTLLVVFESPKRIINTLVEIANSLGEDTRIFLTREMSKLHEEYLKGTVGEIINILQKRDKIYGELTFIIDNTYQKSEKEIEDVFLKYKEAILYLKGKGFSAKDIIHFFSLLPTNLNFPRKKIYSFFKD